MKNYLNINLKGGSMARLAMLKSEAIQYNEKRPTSMFKTWRDVRTCGLHNMHSYCGELSQGRNSKNNIWYCHTGEQFRIERDCNDIVKSLPLGWYTDVDCTDTAIGIIAMITHGRFIAGYRWTSNDERVYFDEVFTDEYEAAQMSDEHARIFAERAQEDDERYQAAMKLESDIEDNTQRLRELIILRHTKCMDYARDEIRDTCEAIREARDTLRTEYKNYI